MPGHDDHQEAEERENDRQDADLQVQGNGSGVTFECKVDKGQFASCTSPFTTQKLSKGKHTFQVRATNSGGGVGNAAKAPFKVVKRKPRHR